MGWMKRLRKGVKKLGRLNRHRNMGKGVKHANKAISSGEAPDYRQMAAGQSVGGAQSAF